MIFSSGAIAEIEGLLEVNQDFRKPQMAEKASPALPPNKSAITLGNSRGEIRSFRVPASFQHTDALCEGWAEPTLARSSSLIFQPAMPAIYAIPEHCNTVQGGLQGENLYFGWFPGAIVAL